MQSDLLTGWSKINGAKFSDACSVRANWLCIGWPFCLAEIRREFQTEENFFCTKLYITESMQPPLLHLLLDQPASVRTSYVNGPSLTSWLGSGVICRSVGWQREKLLYENEDRLKEGRKESDPFYHLRMREGGRAMMPGGIRDRGVGWQRSLSCCSP